MREFLPFIIAGLVTGAIYGLAGTGLVLVYKTSGIFNFGHGAAATAGAYVFYWMHVSQHWSWEISAFVGGFVVGPVLGLLLERVGRNLALQRIAMKVVGTVGFIILADGLGALKYGTDPRRVDAYLPGSTTTFKVGGTVLSYDQIIIVVIAVLLVGVLWWLFRYTRLGVSMRAVVDDPDLLDVHGTNPVVVRRTAWIIGSTMASLAGVLIVPYVGLDPIVLTFLVVQAFGAAAVGWFANIPLTFMGGLLIGVISSLATKYVVGHIWLSGVPSSVPFVVLFIVLIALPRGRLAGSNLHEKRPPIPYVPPQRIRVGGAVLAVALLASVPHVSILDSRLPYFSIGLAEVILFLSLGLLIRTSGQISLCHVTFAGIGAVAFSQLRVGLGVPWPVAVVLAALIVVPIGAIVAIPAIRLSGVFLALATFGFGTMVQSLFYPQSFVFTTSSTGRVMPRPSFASSDTAFYYLILAIAFAVACALAAINQGRLGRLLRGMSDSSLAVSTLGLSTNVTRVMSFCISAFFAAIAGILYGCVIGAATGGATFYSSFNSLVLVAILALAPFAVPWYAILAGMTSVIPGYISGRHVTDWLNVLFGLSAITVAVQGGIRPMPARLRTIVDQLGGRPPSRSLPSSVPSAPLPIVTRRGHDSGLALEVRGLDVRFGGFIAIKGLSFAAAGGSITGLIGPNGAGKTTTFNVCSGLLRPPAGTVILHGEDVSRVSASGRARRGLGRTFQVMQLFDSLTVGENVALGREAALAGDGILTQLFARPRDQGEVEEAVAAALEMCELTMLAGAQVSTLSTGQRRLVELARCLAGRFDYLLLDEPSSGLDAVETHRLGAVLQRVADERGVGMLLVEHDMALVLRVCSHILVLDFGQLIAEGPPASISASEVVRAAYLGNDIPGVDSDGDHASSVVAGETL